jgi:nicotinate-nucleotide adenylyltransferase
VDTETRKIGLFGGTFDPVHKGHLALARGVLSEYGLDELLFIPAPYPPHKNKALTDFRHRVAMLEAALAGEARILVSLVEAQREPPSYTLDTVLALRGKMGNHQYHLLMGADSFVEVHLWYRFQELLRLADVIVAARPGIGRYEIERQVRLLPWSFRPESSGDAWTGENGLCIRYYSGVCMDLSSTEIRRRLRLGEDVSDFLHPEVLGYIREQGLYTGSE